MGNTKTVGPWTFKPTMPEEPTGGNPGAWERYGQDVADHKAVYKLCAKAANRSGVMRQLMIDGYRYRQADIPELERLAAIGREFEKVFGGIAPGQAAKVVDVLLSRFGSLKAPERPAETAPATGQERRERIAQVASSLGDDDPLNGELG